MMNWDNPFAKPGQSADAESTPAVEETPAPIMTATAPEIEVEAEVQEDHAANEPSAIVMPASVPEPPKPDTASVSSLPTANVAPVNPEDKRVINGMTDINQLAPFKYPWAWEYFLNANKNHWTPLDINMAQDVRSSIVRL